MLVPVEHLGKLGIPSVALLWLSRTQVPYHTTLPYLAGLVWCCPHNTVFLVDETVFDFGHEKDVRGKAKHRATLSKKFLLVGRLLLIHQRWYRYHISRQGQYTASNQQILSRQHLKLLLILLPGIVSQAPFISLLWQSSRLFDARTPHQTHTG